jgi:hypothetical protein
LAAACPGVVALVDCPIRSSMWDRLSLPCEAAKDRAAGVIRRTSVWRRITPASSSDGDIGAAVSAPVHGAAPNNEDGAPVVEGSQSRMGRKRRRGPRRRPEASRGPPPPPSPPAFVSGVLESQRAGRTAAVRDVPALRPICVMEFSAGFAREEVDLRRALFVSITGNRPMVSPDMVLDEVARSYDVDRGLLRIHRSNPEDFILFLPDEELAVRVFNGGRHFLAPGFSLKFKRWSRFIHATGGSLPLLANVELRGIPAHAWDRSTVERLLCNLGLIKSVHQCSLDRSDLDVFRVLAWWADGSELRREVDLFIKEPVHGLDESSEKLCLVYPILIEATPVALGEREPVGPPSPPPPPAKGGDDPRGFSPRCLAGSGGSSDDGRSSRGSARGPVHSRLGPPVHTTCHVTPAVTSVLQVVHVPEEEQPSPGDVVHVAPGAATEAPMVVDGVPSGVPDGAVVPAGPMGDDGIEVAAVLGARSRLRDPLLSYSRRRSRVMAVATPPRAPAEQFINRITSKVGSLLPVPKISRRRSKTAQASHAPRQSRRVAGLPVEPRKLDAGSHCCVRLVLTLWRSKSP